MKNLNKALIVCGLTFVIVVAALAIVVAANDNKNYSEAKQNYNQSDEGVLHIESVNPIKYADAKYGNLDIVYSGTIEYEVNDEDFLKRTYKNANKKDEQEYISDYIGEKIVNNVLKMGTSYETIVNNADMISEVFVGSYTGFEITSVKLEFKLSDESELKVIGFDYEL